MILIRPLEEKDLDKVLAIRNECAEYLHDPRLFTREQIHQWFWSLEREHKYFAVSYTGPEVNNHGFSYCFEEFIGYFRTKTYWGLQGYTRYNLKPRTMEIGMDLDAKWRGFGLAEQAYRQFFKSEYAKGIKCFTLEVLGDNIRAYNLYRKLGFDLAGVTEIERNGRKYPSIQMSWSLF